VCIPVSAMRSDTASSASVFIVLMSEPSSNEN
jgi:hypothetical protein